MISRSVESSGLGFNEIGSASDWDYLTLSGYKIVHDKGNNFYSLQRYYPVLYKKNSGVDLDMIKSGIDKNQFAFNLEIDKLKGRVRKNNSYIKTQIFSYLERSRLPDEAQKQIAEIFSAEENMKNYDDFLKELYVETTLHYGETNLYANDIQFFDKLYKKSIKIDKKNLIDGKNSLYDIIYYGKEVYFEDIIANKENYLPTAILSELLEIFDLEYKEISVNYEDKSILIPVVGDISGDAALKIKPLVIPIDESGNLR
ncbi:MAG TPA: hypothetical protein PK385_04180 [Spirochaetota bacterium]|nr:hypothetical protein [Spirochaetota bacterium]HOS31994.1 hypothetical protein [Spirochaetota bacterium]HOS55236.1 hypothetical protein [Spirochaetota bacterium]HPK61147.1 hypothetical protein [Spirochaetota bacterium]HQF77761.1 hypothetical protein [Spirochaetota bacterium]